MRERKEMMCFLAALLMPAANGKVVNALNLAEVMVEEAEKRWPDPPPYDSELARMEREHEERRQRAASALAAHPPASPDGGQQ